MLIDFRLSSPTMLGLKRRLAIEGERFLNREVTVEGVQPDITFTDDLSHSCSGIRVVQGAVLYEPVLRNLGYELLDLKDERELRFFTTKFFNGESFTPQIALTIPVVGLYNKDCGPPIIAATATRYYKFLEPSKVLDNDGLIEFLKASRYFGFVSSEHLARGFGLLNVHLGAPSLSIYNFMQAMNLPIGEWFRTPQRLLESWSLSLLVSDDKYKEQRSIATSPQLERRVYWITQDSSEDRKGFVQHQQDLLAVVSAWSYQLRGCQQLALEACREIQCPSKLYRTDVANEVENVLDLIRSQLPAS